MSELPKGQTSVQRHRRQREGGEVRRERGSGKEVSTKSMHGLVYGRVWIYAYGHTPGYSV